MCFDAFVCCFDNFNCHCRFSSNCARINLLYSMNVQGSGSYCMCKFFPMCVAVFLHICLMTQIFLAEQLTIVNKMMHWILFYLFGLIITCNISVAEIVCLLMLNVYVFGFFLYCCIDDTCSNETLAAE